MVRSSVNQSSRPASVSGDGTFRTPGQGGGAAHPVGIRLAVLPNPGVVRDCPRAETHTF